jgi:hypothetical protein
MKTRRYDLVMALFPNTRGFAYVIFEGPFSPVDWGVSDVRGGHKNQDGVRRISVLLTRHAPDVIVLRRVSCPQPERARRLLQLIDRIKELAEMREIALTEISREQVRQTFGYLGSPTRYAVVEAIVKHIPLFSPYVPPARKIWKSEDRRMGLFDAAALALTFFHVRAGAVLERVSENTG